MYAIFENGGPFPTNLSLPNVTYEVVYHKTYLRFIQPEVGSYNTSGYSSVEVGSCNNSGYSSVALGS